MIYDKEYFIKKFESIPENEIGTGGLKQHCALWHCGVRNGYGTAGWGANPYLHTEESKALCILLGGDEDFENVWEVNDLHADTPKENILKALHSIK